MASDIINKQVRHYRGMIEKNTNDVSQIWIDFQSCLNIAGFNKEKLEYIKNQLVDMKSILSVGADDNNKNNKKAVIETLVGPQIENEIGIKNPQMSRTKGCGKRIKSSAEISKHVPKRRKCASCGKVDGHNARTCPSKEK